MSSQATQTHMLPSILASGRNMAKQTSVWTASSSPNPDRAQCPVTTTSLFAGPADSGRNQKDLQQALVCRDSVAAIIPCMLHMFHRLSEHVLWLAHVLWLFCANSDARCHHLDKCSPAVLLSQHDMHMLAGLPGWGCVVNLDLY